MIKFFVSTRLGTTHSAKENVFGFDKHLIIKYLQEENCVYVFDALEDAKSFVKLITSPPSAWVLLNFISPTIDYPIFEVDAPEYFLHDKRSELVTGTAVELLPIKVFTPSGSEIKKLNPELNLNVSNGLRLTAEEIIDVYSARGHSYCFDNLSEDRCIMS